MSCISDPGQIGGFIGSTGWYRATGESVTAPDGSIAWRYTNPYTWFDGSDRNQGSEVVMWGIELRSPLTEAPVPRSLYVVSQAMSLSPQGFTNPGGPPEIIATTPFIVPGDSAVTVQTPEPSYSLIVGLILIGLTVVFRRRIRT